MPSRKIAIIGGGSPYVPGILFSMANTARALRGAEIALMDIDPAPLPMMTAIGQRMAAAAGADQRITRTTDLREALADASFVLTNFRPGGLEGLRLDEAIPDRYGVLGTGDDWPWAVSQPIAAVAVGDRLCRDQGKPASDEAQSRH